MRQQVAFRERSFQAISLPPWDCYKLTGCLIRKAVPKYDRCFKRTKQPSQY